MVYSELASTYDSRHGKTLDKLVEEIRARVDFLGVDWADDDGEDDEDVNGDKEREEKNAESGEATQKKTVRLLDYACGTGVGECLLFSLLLFVYFVYPLLMGPE